LARYTSWSSAPFVDVVDKEHSYEVTAELPGMDPSNITVKFSTGTLTIKGEKKEEKEEKGKDYVLSERRWGSFQRSFRVPTSIDEEKIEAIFSNGVLTIVLPKSAEAQQAEKTIDIKRGVSTFQCYGGREAPPLWHMSPSGLTF